MPVTWQLNARGPDLNSQLQFCPLIPRPQLFTVMLCSLTHLCTAKEVNCLFKHNSAKHCGWPVVGGISCWSPWLLILSLKPNKKKKKSRSKSKIKTVKQKWHFVKGGQSQQVVIAWVLLKFEREHEAKCSWQPLHKIVWILASTVQFVSVHLQGLNAYSAIIFALI